MLEETEHAVGRLLRTASRVRRNGPGMGWYFRTVSDEHTMRRRKLLRMDKAGRMLRRSDGRWVLDRPLGCDSSPPSDHIVSCRKASQTCHSSRVIVPISVPNVATRSCACVGVFGPAACSATRVAHVSLGRTGFNASWPRSRLFALEC